MKAIILLLFLLQQGIPKFSPNGIWEAESGSKFRMQLTGNNLKIQIVEGSNPKFLKYELDLKTDGKEESVNSYAGKGYFLAKLSNGKECRFDTEWQFTIVSPERLYGIMSLITPDPNTCAIKEKSDAPLELKKK